MLKDPKAWAMIVYCGISSAMWTGTFAVALGFTSLTKVYLLNNCQPILLVLWNKIRGKRVTIPQSVGVILGMLGLLLTVYSSDLFTVSKEEIIGDIVALFGAVFAAMYLSVGSDVRKNIPGTFSFMVPIWLVSCVLFGVGALTWEKASFFDLVGWFQQPT